MSANNLSGMVPPPLYNLPYLSVVTLAINELEGSLPADLGFTLPNLKIFFAGLNKFSGYFPQSITNATKLVLLTYHVTMLEVLYQ